MYLICHMTSQDHLIEGSCSVYEWKPLVVYHHRDKFGDHRNCDSADLMFLICHVTSRNHAFKRLIKFMIGRSSQ